MGSRGRRVIKTHWLSTSLQVQRENIFQGNQQYICLYTHIPYISNWEGGGREGGTKGEKEEGRRRRKGRGRERKCYQYLEKLHPTSIDPNAYFGLLMSLYVILNLGAHLELGVYFQKQNLFQAPDYHHMIFRAQLKWHTMTGSQPRKWCWWLCKWCNPCKLYLQPFVLPLALCSKITNGTCYSDSEPRSVATLAWRTPSRSKQVCVCSRKKKFLALEQLRAASPARENISIHPV